MPAADVFVSVVMPLFDDADIIEPVVTETIAMLSHHYANYELVLVDDGSRDSTAARALDLLNRFPCMRLIRLSRRFGQEIAISAGLESVIGDFVAVMLPDGDPPSAIPEMVARSRDGAGVVFGIRRSREGEPGWLRAGAAAFYALSNGALGLHIPRNSAHLRVLSRQALNAMLQSNDRARYLRTLSAFVGYGPQGMEYDPVPRRARQRVKGIVTAIDLAISIVVSNTTRPLRLVSLAALLASAAYGVTLLYIVNVYLFKSRVAEGWTTLSFQAAFGFCVLFAILAVLCAYLERMLGELRSGPLYYVLDEHNSASLVANEHRRNVVTQSADRQP